ncbi:SOS response-associated peptidase [Thalassotalea euphylliae]|uniref:SOS response-associated peptidase n=1 Tax=Thalassotalea euphylliae TaxID=1655234 RepID=UPI00364055D2
MCGRMNVIDDAVCQFISSMLGIEFSTLSNPDLRPTNTVSTVIRPPAGFQQVDASWGIKPDWSNKLLINAQSETVDIKPTFRDAFDHSRCLVPVNSWFEWKAEGDKKQKYEISRLDESPMFMAGILYNPEHPQLVTLTAKPTGHCADIHHRIPVIVQPENIADWFDTPSHSLIHLMSNTQEKTLKAVKCS